MENINPKISLIGVGKNNKFGHPNKSVINKLNSKKIKIYRTDINGEINIILMKKKMKIETMYK